MKIRTSIIVAAVVAVLAAPPRPARAEVGVSISFFYDELAPYGRWETVGRWGDCWIPSHVATGWQPYTDGEWVYTEYGWTWVSYDPWGGDPYHYGTWIWEDPWGWVWVPGTVWGPAWVTWCYGDDYVGWAPIPPSLSISWSGYAGRPVVVSRSSYVFVPVNRFVGTRVSSVRLPVERNAAIFPRLRKVTSFSVSRGVVVNRGPSVARIERAGHVRIPRRSISEVKSRPVPLASSGVARGHRVAVAAPAPVRAREIGARRTGAKPGTGAPSAREAAPRRETHPSPGEKRAAPPPQTRRESAPGRRRESPPPPVRREASPPRREAAPPRREAPPPARHEAPPPRREAPPPVRREAPPPRREAPPPVRHEAPPARHEAPPPPPRGGPGQRRATPPRHEPPPPPPPSHGKKEPDGPSRLAR